MFASKWTLLYILLVLTKKWEFNSMPCKHDAARNLLGICWVHTVFLLKPGCIRRHRWPQVRRGWEQEKGKENRQKGRKGCYPGCISEPLFIPLLNASWVRKQPFSKVKTRIWGQFVEQDGPRFKVMIHTYFWFVKMVLEVANSIGHLHTADKACPQDIFTCVWVNIVLVTQIIIQKIQNLFVLETNHK